MADIYLTKEQWNRLPYKTTKINKGKTYGEIIGLLESHGISDYRWTKLQDTDTLEFPLVIKRDDVEQQFAVKITVPRLYFKKSVGKGRNAPKQMTYLEEVSWRIFWWHLKSKLEAIEYGISDEVREFMYNINYALPDGTEVNLGEALIRNVENLNKLSALPEPAKGSRKVVEVQYKESHL